MEGEGEKTFKRKWRGKQQIKGGEAMKDERVAQRGQDGGWKLIKEEGGAEDTENAEARERKRKRERERKKREVGQGGREGETVKRGLP